MADAVVGSVAVDVVPSAEDFWSQFKAKTQSGAKKAGDDLGQSIGGPISDRVSESVSEGLGKAAPSSKEQGSRQGASFADAFDKELTTRLDAALKNLPNAEINADTSDAQAAILQLREQIDQVNKAIGVDITDDQALAKIEEIRVSLESLSKESPDIRVRVDAGAAELELATLQRQIDKINKGPNGPGGVGGGALGGLGSGAESAGFSISNLLLPAVGALATLIGPLAAVGAGTFGTIALGAKGLESEVSDKLTPAFKDLENTATNALLPGVDRALDQVAQALPRLTPLVSFFGTEVGDVADQFATWLNNGGLASFTTYAERELPIVEHAVESLTTAGIKLFGALTPLGNALLGTLTKISDAVSFILDGFGKFNSGLSGAVTPSNSSGAGKSNSALAYFGAVAKEFTTLGGLLGGSTPGQGSLHTAFVNKTPSAAVGPTLNSQALQQAASGGGIPQLPLVDQVGQSALRMAADMQDAAASTMAATNQVNALAKSAPNANTAIQGLLTGLSAYATSAGDAAAKSQLLGAVLVASQGDALSYAGAISQGYAATNALVQTFQQQAAATKSTAGSVNTTAQAAALDRVTAATSRLNAAQIKSGTPAKTAAAAASSAASVASAQAAVNSANAALDKAAKPTGGVSASESFADTEKAAIDLNTGLINLKATGAAPLVQQLQAMQDAATKAAQATYQHEVATKGQSAALQDAQTIFESMTNGALVQNAKQLGLTSDQAKKLADQYFAIPDSVTTEVQSIGLNDVNTTLQNIGIQLSYLTGKPFQIDLSLNASTLGKTLHDVVNDIGAPAGHAYGGMISGPGSGTSDSILARLSNGEYVSTAASTSRNASALAAGNRGATLVAHYAAGGPVGAIAASPSGTSGVLEATIQIGDRVVDVLTTAITEKQTYNRFRR